jgi:hypothetical protein
VTRMQTLAQLRRLGDLSTIHRAIVRLGPATTANIGLMEIASACRQRARISLERDYHAARDELLTIACEWDLQRDRIDKQSDACLAAIADFLR